jgi:hypothetical protein
MYFSYVPRYPRVSAIQSFQIQLLFHISGRYIQIAKLTVTQYYKVLCNGINFLMNYG